ncbi:MAG TPA: cupin domain-containing protein [Phycisphaerae bacterium]|nr:cupin domain-containing protein [Phycisphaerae bacterium]
MKIQSIKAHRQEPVAMPGAKGARIRILVGPEDGAEKFHMRHFEVEPGGCTPHHQHDYEHEILVLKGAGLARSEQGDRPFKPGDVIFVPSNEMHQFCNTGQEPCEFICLIPAPCNCAR